MSKKSGLALVLSGGAARGIAHLGILQAMEEAGIRPSVISGVSAGAIVGAFYCSGYPPKKILEIAKKTPFVRTFRPTRSPGLLKLSKAEELFHEYLKTEHFENLDIPLIISATDVDLAQTVYFSTGKIIPPLLGSSSFPPFFRPVNYNGMTLSDGGLINNLPVEPVKDYQLVLGVNVNIVRSSPDTFAQYSEWVATVVVTNNIQESKKLCHVFFEPPGMKEFRIIDIGKADEMFEIGYLYARERMPQVLELLQA